MVVTDENDIIIDSALDDCLDYERSRDTLDDITFDFWPKYIAKKSRLNSKGVNECRVLKKTQS